jgi:hypothetical protein
VLLGGGLLIIEASRLQPYYSHCVKPEAEHPTQQHKAPKVERCTCLRRVSNPHSHQANRRRSTPIDCAATGVGGRNINSGKYVWNRGPGSSVGIATGYGLDGPGIESRWGRDFSAPVQTGPGAHPASCKMDTGSFPRVKAACARR